MATYKFIPSLRGGKLIAYEEYLYRIERKRNGRSFWRCSSKEHCTARIILDANEVLVRISGSHTHEKQSRLIQTKLFSQRLKDRAAETDVTVPLKKIYDEEVAKEGDACLQLQSYETVARKMYKARHKKIPSLKRREIKPSRNCRVYCEGTLEASEKTSGGEDSILLDSGDGSNSMALEKDMANYIKYKLVGGKVILNQGVIPHKFSCQRPISFAPPRVMSERRQRKALVADLLASAYSTSTIADIVKKKSRKAAGLSTSGSIDIGAASGIKPEIPLQNLEKSTREPQEHFGKILPSETSAKKRKLLSTSTISEQSDPHLEPEVVIKEEPIDIDEEDVYNLASSSGTSLTKDEFILPYDGWPSTSGTEPSPSPSVGVAFSVSNSKKDSDPQNLEPASSVCEKPSTSKGPSRLKKTQKYDDDEKVPSENNSDDSSVADSKPSDRPKDQFDVYGEYIAAKLRKLDWKSCAYVQKAIGDIIFEAEMGKYSQEHNVPVSATQ